MATEKVPFDRLKNFLPENTYELVMPLITKHKVHLLIAKERQTKLGDYRHAYNNRNHRISINSNLNKFSFLITLLHELGHLLAFEKFGNRILPHGKEWKKMYGDLLSAFLQQQVFPNDVAAELQAILHNPGASSCAEETLMRVLRKYDNRPANATTVEELAEGNLFKMANGREFIRGEKMRKRIKCKEITTGKLYLFSPLFEVMKL